MSRAKQIIVFRNIIFVHLIILLAKNNNFEESRWAVRKQYSVQSVYIVQQYAHDMDLVYRSQEEAGGESRRASLGTGQLVGGSA